MGPQRRGWGESTCVHGAGCTHGRTRSNGAEPPPALHGCPSCAPNPQPCAVPGKLHFVIHTKGCVQKLCCEPHSKVWLGSGCSGTGLTAAKRSCTDFAALQWRLQHTASLGLHAVSPSGLLQGQPATSRACFAALCSGEETPRVQPSVHLILLQGTRFFLATSLSPVCRSVGMGLTSKQGVLAPTCCGCCSVRLGATFGCARKSFACWSLCT